jgi:hypothetical protein
MCAGSAGGGVVPIGARLPERAGDDARLRSGESEPVQALGNARERWRDAGEERHVRQRQRASRASAMTAAATGLR